MGVQGLYCDTAIKNNANSKQDKNNLQICIKVRSFFSKTNKLTFSYLLIHKVSKIEFWYIQWEGNVEKMLQALTIQCNM